MSRFQRQVWRRRSGLVEVDRLTPEEVLRAQSYSSRAWMAHSKSITFSRFRSLSWSLTLGTDPVLDGVLGPKVPRAWFDAELDLVLRAMMKFDVGLNEALRPKFDNVMLPNLFAVFWKVATTSFTLLTNGSSTMTTRNWYEGEIKWIKK